MWGVDAGLMREFVACWAHTRGDTRQRINWAAPAVGARGAAHASKDAPSPTGFSIFWYLVRTDARGAGKGEGNGSGARQTVFFRTKVGPQRRGYHRASARIEIDALDQNSGAACTCHLIRVD